MGCSRIIKLLEGGPYIFWCFSTRLLLYLPILWLYPFTPTPAGGIFLNVSLGFSGEDCFFDKHQEAKHKHFDGL